MTRLLALALTLLIAVTAQAAERPLDLTGEFQQGGMVIGKTEPGARVRYAGRDVRVTGDGTFVIGFHRDEPQQRDLTVTFADGGTRTVALKIRQRDYDIQRIDGLDRKKVTPPESVLQRIREDAALVRAARKRDTGETWFLDGFIWPAKGRISGVYGSQRILNGKPRQPHYGIDIAAPRGTDVVAPAAGVVSMVHEDMYFSGGTILIDHGHGLTSGFLHMDTIRVADGDFVERGAVIGTVGATGRATGPHLDWRINWFDKRLDPALLVPPRAPGG